MTGILIALGLEAAIEAYREHALVERARADPKSTLYQFQINKAHEAALWTAGRGLIAVYDKALAAAPAEDAARP